jgi:flavin-dependent dehydrogenase
MVRILGGGPAGAAAAIAALGEGAEAEIYEEGRVPRHKVCGEFLSPEARSVLKRLGAAEECVRAAPARIDRFELHIGRRVKQCQLPEPAWGLSRYRLDHILLERAQTLGARVLRERRTEGQADVVAHGRRAVTQWNAGFRHNRPFGFKAHFRGPSSDAVELYFFQFGYIGVTPIEDGLVNICGLAREHLLREHGFDPGALAAARPDLAERLRPLSRTMDWMFTGPVLPREDFTWRKSGP